MQLLVIRHAIAEDARHGQDDSSRELTEAGRKKAKRAVRGMRALDLGFERLLTSPWARARETAELLAPLGEGPAIVTELLSQAPRAELLALISETGTTTAVVGHEPWLGELVAWLAFGDPRHGDALLIKKAGVVWLEGTAVPGGMMLRALLPPKILRAVG